MELRKLEFSYVWIYVSLLAELVSNPSDLALGLSQCSESSPQHIRQWYEEGTGKRKQSARTRQREEAKARANDNSDDFDIEFSPA